MKDVDASIQTCSNFLDFDVTKVADIATKQIIASKKCNEIHLKFAIIVVDLSELFNNFFSFIETQRS